MSRPIGKSAFAELVTWIRTNFDNEESRRLYESSAKKHRRDYFRPLTKRLVESLAEDYEGTELDEVVTRIETGGRRGDLNELLEASEVSNIEWDALYLIAQEHLRGREPLPDDLADWLADVLEDLTPSQKKETQRSGVSKRPRPGRGSDEWGKYYRMTCAIGSTYQQFQGRLTKETVVRAVAKAFCVSFKLAERYALSEADWHHFGLEYEFEELTAPPKIIP